MAERHGVSGLGPVRRPSPLGRDPGRAGPWPSWGRRGRSLNGGRLATGLFNLVIIPFKDSLVRGILFLIPPFTILDLYRHLVQLSRPARRVIEPAVTIGLVALAFVFIPSLRRDGPPTGGIADRDPIRRTGDRGRPPRRGQPGRALDLKGLAGEADRKLEAFAGHGLVDPAGAIADEAEVPPRAPLDDSGGHEGAATETKH